MKKYLKRLTSLLVVVALMLSAVPMVFANTAAFSDFPTGWSAPAMSAAISNGLLTGFGDDTIRPGANLTRAEVATIITRAFGAQTTADVSAFADVPANAWFTPYIARAVKMGALNGMSATTMGPDLPITREQVFTAVGRILVLSNDNAAVLSKFNDADSISSWAVPYMSALVERGYVNGDNLGNVNPQAYITREEFAQFMYNTIRTYITQAGTYNASLEGITVIRTSGVRLNNLYVTSDLVVGDGAGAGEIVLSGVNIEKRLLARGGTITVSNSTNGEGVVVNNVNGVTQFMNYRTDLFFKSLTENTKANFLSYSPSFGGSTGGNRPGSDDDGTQYTLNFYLFGEDTTPYATLLVDEGDTLGADLPAPSADEIFGYEFLGWFDKTDATKQITGTTVIGADMELVAKLEAYPVVTFYSGYSTATILGKAGAKEENDYKVLVADIPEITVEDHGIEGYTKDSSVASVYADAETFYTLPTYWYEAYTFVCADCGHEYQQSHAPEACTNCSASADRIAKDETRKAILVPFDETTVVLGNLNVYRLSKNLALLLKQGTLTFGVVTAYSDETRLADSVKDLAVHAGNQLDYAISNNQIPKYDQIKEEAVTRFSALIDEDMNVKVYYLPFEISKLITRTAAEGMFAEQIGVEEFNVIKNEAYYRTFMDQMMEEEEIVVNSTNVAFVKDAEIAIQNLTYDEAMAETPNTTLKNLEQVLGKAFVESLYDDMRDRYCAGLELVIADVELNGEAEEYTTFLQLGLNLPEILEDLYAKAKNKVDERLKATNVHYAENPYLQYLVDADGAYGHDVIAQLFDYDAALKSDVLTGYTLKSEMDYYNYVVSLLFVVDDALCWYSENGNLTLDDAEVKAVYDAVLGEIYNVHVKLGDVLETYVNENRLPSKVETVVNQFQQLNSLLTRFDSQLKAAINKYLGSNIHEELENGTLGDNEKFRLLAEILIGAEEPTFTIDSLYTLFYQYDDNVQKQLKKYVDSDELKSAIERFEATAIGEQFKGDGTSGTAADQLAAIEATGKVDGAFDSIYDLLVVIAEKGIEPFRVEDEVVTVEDCYKVTVANTTLQMKRYYQ